MDNIDFKNQVIEEIEFDLITATRSGAESLIPGLERALEIIEEVSNG